MGWRKCVGFLCLALLATDTGINRVICTQPLQHALCATFTYTQSCVLHAKKICANYMGDYMGKIWEIGFSSSLKQALGINLIVFS